MRTVSESVRPTRDRASAACLGLGLVVHANPLLAGVSSACITVRKQTKKLVECRREHHASWEATVFRLVKNGTDDDEERIKREFEDLVHQISEEDLKKKGKSGRGIQTEKNLFRKND